MNLAKVHDDIMRSQHKSKILSKLNKAREEIGLEKRKPLLRIMNMTKSFMINTVH